MLYVFKDGYERAYQNCELSAAELAAQLRATKYREPKPIRAEMLG